MVGLTEVEVRAALDAVVDPCSVVAGAPAGLVQMGFVRARHDQILEQTQGPIAFALGPDSLFWGGIAGRPYLGA